MSRRKSSSARKSAGARSASPNGYSNLTIHEAFRVIEKARNNGKPIVPLIGAGLSAESGIPTTTLLIDYFAKVKTLIEIRRGRQRRRREGEGDASPVGPDDEFAAQSEYRDYLLRAGWPELKSAAVELLTEYTRSWDGKPSRRVLEFVHDYVQPAGNFLAGIRLRALYKLLERDQPTLAGVIGPEYQQGPAPGASPASGRYRDFVRQVQDYVRKEFNKSLSNLNGLVDAERRKLGKLKPEAYRRLRKAISSDMTDLRSRLLKDLRMDWRLIMRSLTSGDPALADSLFERMVRLKRPTVGHQVLALLTQSLGWNLWLTTNFDTLIEQALREQRIEPVVFELPENGPAPDASLLRGAPSVVKLHGGAFGLRVGESLDVPLDAANLARFVDYFPEDALVLVIGYGGADNRVMSLIDHLAYRHIFEEGGLPKILWVHRSDKPPARLTQSARLAKRPAGTVSVVRYRSGGLFLRELHARLLGLHPAGRTPYSSLPMVAPFQYSTGMNQNPQNGRAQQTSASRCEDDERLTRSVTFFGADHSGSGTTLRLADLVRDLDDSHVAIWFELAEVPTVHALVAAILGELRKYDPEFTPQTLVKPPGCKAREARQKALELLENGHYDEALSAAEAIAKPLAGRLALGLRRGKYVLALDSAGEFARDEFAHDVDDPKFAVNGDEAKWQTLLLYGLLRCLSAEAANHAALGESKLCAAVTPLEAVGSKECKESADELYHHVQTSAYLMGLGPAAPGCKPVSAGPPTHLKGLMDDALAYIPSRGRAEVTRTLERFTGHVPKDTEVLFDCLGLSLDYPPEKEPPPADLKKLTEKDERPAAPKELKAKYRALLAIAAAFRRPRSRINLRRLAANTKISPALAAGLDDDSFGAMLAKLDEFRLLVHLEGGFYWMHSQARNHIHRSDWWQVLDGSPAVLHEAIADEYIDLLRQSKSRPALYEAAYHLFTALAQNCDDRAERHRLARRLRTLIGQASSLLVDGDPARILGWLGSLSRRLKEVLDDGKDADDDPEHRIRLTMRRLRSRLRELRARVLVHTAAYSAAACVRERQLTTIRDRDAPKNQTDKYRVGLREAYLLKEHGRCRIFLPIRGTEGSQSDENAAEKSLSEADTRCERIAAELEHTSRSNRYPDLLRRAQEIRIESLLALSELHLNRVQPWTWERSQTRETSSPAWPQDQKQEWNQAGKYHDDANRVLKKASDLFAGDFAHLSRSYWLLDARLKALNAEKKDFDGSFQSLATAEAMAFAGDDVQSAADLTDIRLQSARGLLVSAGLAADGDFRPAGGVRAMVSAKIKQTAVALEQARSVLLGGEVDVRRWAQFGLLQAYMRHERVLLFTWASREPEGDDDDPLRPHPTPAEADDHSAVPKVQVDPLYETLIQQGLRDLGLVYELCRRDSMLRDELHRLWLQFLTSFLFHRQVKPGSPEADDAYDDWTRWNDNAALPLVPPVQDGPTNTKLPRPSAMPSFKTQFNEVLTTLACDPADPSRQKKISLSNNCPDRDGRAYRTKLTALEKEIVHKYPLKLTER
jgi:hypothetical protein